MIAEFRMFHVIVRRWPPRVRRDAGPTADGGAASVWVAGIGLCVIALAYAVAMAGDGVVADRRARIAADFGALAGARYSAVGAEYACDQARSVVEANEARLVECRLEGLDLLVTVECFPKGPAGPRRATARAGPVRVTAIQPLHTALSPLR